MGIHFAHDIRIKLAQFFLITTRFILGLHARPCIYAMYNIHNSEFEIIIIIFQVTY